jgi:hypothetical protein
MAREWTGWFGDRHIELSQDDMDTINRNRQFTQDMNNVGANVQSEMGGALASGVAGTAALVVGTGALTYGAIKSKRIRYVVQAVLHLPMSWMIAWGVCLLASMGPMGLLSGDVSGISDEQMVTWIVVCWALASVISIVWTAIYVKVRTLTKWRALAAMEQQAAAEAAQAQYDGSQGR